MKSRLVQWRDQFALVAEVFAIGRALDDGVITAAQASNAIGRVGLRDDLRHLDRGLHDSPVLREGELVDAR